MKRCGRCGASKPLEEFSRRAASPDGRQNNCKECARTLTAEWIEKNYEKFRSYLANWQDENKENVRAATRRGLKKYKLRHPEIVAAWYAVREARRKGILVKPDICQGCKRPEEKLETHHWDYSQPLVVDWLCRACHLEADKLRREAIA